MRSVEAGGKVTAHGIANKFARFARRAGGTR